MTRASFDSSHPPEKLDPQELRCTPIGAPQAGVYPNPELVQSLRVAAAAVTAHAPEERTTVDPSGSEGWAGDNGPAGTVDWTETVPQ